MTRVHSKTCYEFADRSGASTRAPGGSAPYAILVINGECLDVSALLQPLGGTSWRNTLTTATNAGQLAITATYDTDPFINFAASTTNLIQGPVTFTFLFGTPIVPGTYNHATNTGSLSLTSANGTATVATSATYPSFISGYGTLGGAPTNLGVDLGTATCSTTSTTTCSQGSTSSTFAPAFYDGLEPLQTYEQTGLSSMASWSGFVTIDVATTTTPEPMSIALLASGLIVIAGVARRRRA